MPLWTILALDFTPLQFVIDCLPVMLFGSSRQVASESVDLAIFVTSTLWLTVSGNAVKSTATQIVQC